MAQDVEVGRNEQPTSGHQQSGGQAQSRPAGGDDSRSMLPRVDVLEDEAGITLVADLPGVPREMLDVKVESDTLVIEGTVAPQTPQEMEPVYVEVRVPRFRRTFALSRELDTGRIEANLADGVLSLRIPKQEHARPRRISVQIA